MIMIINIIILLFMQALHNLPHRATKWLLMFIGSLLVYLGKFSLPIQRIAASFPGTLYLRGQYLDEKVSNPTIIKHVVCSSCHTLYTMPKCSKTTASAQIKVCDKCSGQKPLFKKVVTGSKWIRLYPRLLFPACSLISSLGVLLASPGFADLCEEWRLGHATNSDQLNDVFNGKVWNEFLDDKGRLFFSEEFTIGLMLNVDWFNPFVHKVYSCGVIFLSILNLPRAIRYKRENIILVGLIPGPNEPSLTINSYLQPLVKELLLLWKGVQFQTSKGCKLYRCALLCVACDTPAARKVAGFLGHSADLGCLKCYKHFGTGQFGVMDYSGFDRSQWKLRTEKQHRQDASSVELAKSKRERSKLESERGCRYSSLLALPYFDPIKMVIIDPMHNLYLGTAKRIFKLWTDREILDSKALTIINNRIASMCIPPGSSFSRLPSTIGSSSFTAEQWMVWVNYYSICCLHTLLPSNHMECWQLFVLASRLVSKYTISKEEITLADALLLQFCKKFQTIFGKESITPNIHLHCHLHDCIKNFGPVSSFWLFPYERFNGVLGDEPTNNHSIELQVMKRFLEDNCYLRLLHSAPNSTTVSEFFRPVVANHAFQFGSVKTTSNYEQHQKTTSGINYVLPKKYTQEHLSSAEHMIVHQLYLKLYSSLLEFPSQNFPSIYKKVTSITLSGKRVSCGDYVLAQHGEIPNTVATTFSDPSLRPAKINHFVVHDLVNNSTTFSHVFAAVSWPKRHPQQFSVGKLVEVWNSYIVDPELPCIIPVNSIKSSLCIINIKIQSETLLLTIPI